MNICNVKDILERPLHFSHEAFWGAHIFQTLISPHCFVFFMAHNNTVLIESHSSHQHCFQASRKRKVNNGRPFIRWTETVMLAGKCLLTC